MSAAEKAKRTVLGIAIPRDELAFRIAQGAFGMRAPIGTNPTSALDAMNQVPTNPGDPDCPRMGEGFRRAADAAVLFFHRCVNEGRQPS